MQKFWFLLAILFASTIVGMAQAPAATPTPATDTDVVKISTNLVQVDVTVTDKNGKVIRDLRPDEIEIYQNGKKQEVSNFSFISNTRETTEGGEQPAAPKLQKGEVPIPPSPLKAANVKRTIALVVDDLNLSWESINSVRDSLKKFVDVQMRDGDLVAIIRTGAGIGALQQFTNDKRQLYAAIEKIRYNAMGTGSVGSFTPLEGKGEIEASLPISSDNLKKADAEFRSSVFATGTLGALYYVVRGMADLPGRKSIMLLTDGFALYTKDADGNRDSTRVYDGIKVLVDKANRASVVIYTMDPRGLISTAASAADDLNGMTDQARRDLDSDRALEVAESQDGPIYLSKETGGTSLINNNDLSGGIRKILDDQSYYLVGYLPDDETFDSEKRRFNEMSVKVTRPGAKVRYRSGFFGVSDEKKADKPVAERTVNHLVEALTSPFAVNDIQLRLNALFGNSSWEGSYVRSFIRIRSEDLTFTDGADGTKKATIDVLAVAFGDNGSAIDQLSKTIAITVKKETYEAFLKNGYIGDFYFPMKKPGAYQLRVAIRDHGTGKVGSANQFIEVPDLKKKRLTLSSVAVENISVDTWKKRNSGSPAKPDERSTAKSDTAARQFKRGTVLNYAASIYNVKPQPALTSQIRLFRDGKMVFEGKVRPIAPGRQSDPKTADFSSSLNLGTDLEAGDYVLQIIVRNTADQKQGPAVQFVQFELVN